MTTTAEFIEKARLIHGDKYDYSRTVYTTSKAKVEIICPAHGMFVQMASNHTGAKAGCPVCGGTKQITTEEFIVQSKTVHGDLYDYSLAEYANATTKLELICRRHGVFSITPDAHKRGQGCAKCKGELIGALKRGNLNQFLTKAIEVHGKRYDYSLVTEYLGNKHKVPVTCRQHGPFAVSPNNHQRGRGCPLCKKSGYRINRPGNFYILASGNVIKVGITNRDPKFRAKEVSKSAGKKFEIVFSLNDEDGLKILRLEQQTLAFLKDNFKFVEEKHDGSTESFLDVDTGVLAAKINELFVSI